MKLPSAEDRDEIEKFMSQAITIKHNTDPKQQPFLLSLINLLQEPSYDRQQKSEKQTQSLLYLISVFLEQLLKKQNPALLLSFIKQVIASDYLPKLSDEEQNKLVSLIERDYPETQEITQAQRAFQFSMDCAAKSSNFILVDFFSNRPSLTKEGFSSTLKELIRNENFKENLRPYIEKHPSLFAVYPDGKSNFQILLEEAIEKQNLSHVRDLFVVGASSKQLNRSQIIAALHFIMITKGNVTLPINFETLFLVLVKIYHTSDDNPKDNLDKMNEILSIVQMKWHQARSAEPSEAKKAQPSEAEKRQIIDMNLCSPILQAQLCINWLEWDTKNPAFMRIAEFKQMLEHRLLDRSELQEVVEMATCAIKNLLPEVLETLLFAKVTVEGVERSLLTNKNIGYFLTPQFMSSIQVEGKFTEKLRSVIELLVHEFIRTVGDERSKSTPDNDPIYSLLKKWEQNSENQPDKYDYIIKNILETMLDVMNSKMDAQSAPWLSKNCERLIKLLFPQIGSASGYALSTDMQSHEEETIDPHKAVRVFGLFSNGVNSLPLVTELETAIFTALSHRETIRQDPERMLNSWAAYLCQSSVSPTNKTKLLKSLVMGPINSSCMDFLLRCLKLPLLGGETNFSFAFFHLWQVMKDAYPAIKPLIEDILNVIANELGQAEAYLILAMMAQINMQKEQKEQKEQKNIHALLQEEASGKKLTAEAKAQIYQKTMPVMLQEFRRNSIISILLNCQGVGASDISQKSLVEACTRGSTKQELSEKTQSIQKFLGRHLTLIQSMIDAFNQANQPQDHAETKENSAAAAAMP